MFKHFLEDLPENLAKGALILLFVLGAGFILLGIYEGIKNDPNGCTDMYARCMGEDVPTPELCQKAYDRCRGETP